MNLEEELAEFERRKKELEAAFAEIDAAFQRWKEEILKFEHMDYSTDDINGDDDWLCDGECLRTSENESNNLRAAGQNDEEHRNNCQQE